MKKVLSGKLSFVDNLIVDQNKNYTSLLEGSHSNWGLDLNPEDLEENLRDWREKKVCSWKTAKGVKEKFANQNEISHFVFNTEKIRLIRDDGYKNNFSIMDQGSWEMTNYYNFKGQKGKHAFSFKTESTQNWNVDFFIKKEKNITKKILGFNCYKTLIIELKLSLIHI